MFYAPGSPGPAGEHGLPRNPFKSAVVPRPIGWISTRSLAGVDNLAPYSQFQNVNHDPPIVMFCANQSTTGRRKDSVTNAEQTGSFVWNLATYELREAVNVTAEELDEQVDEFERAGLEKVEANLVQCSRVARSPIAFECHILTTLRLPSDVNSSTTHAKGAVDVVFGRVIGIHIADSALTDGMVDVLKMRPLARLGYYQYTSVTEVFEMRIPGTNTQILRGLEGASGKDDDGTRLASDSVSVT